MNSINSLLIQNSNFQSNSIELRGLTRTSSISTTICSLKIVNIFLRIIKLSSLSCSPANLIISFHSIDAIFFTFFHLMSAHFESYKNSLTLSHIINNALLLRSSRLKQIKNLVCAPKSSTWCWCACNVKYLVNYFNPQESKRGEKKKE